MARGRRSGPEGQAHPPQGSGVVPAPDAWQRAIGALLAADTLNWHDHDKKGRPRQRECRPYLLDLRLIAGPSVPGAPEPWAAAAEAAVELALEAAIDPQGRSLRPEQVAHWLGELLGSPCSCSGCAAVSCACVRANLLL